MYIWMLRCDMLTETDEQLLTVWHLWLLVDVILWSEANYFNPQVMLLDRDKALTLYHRLNKNI
jgi:hypothetical protein